MAMPKAAVVARIEVRMSYPPIASSPHTTREAAIVSRESFEGGERGNSERKFAVPFIIALGCPSEVPTQSLRLSRELRQSFPVEADSVAGPGWRQCRALVEDERVLDIPIEPKSVRLEIGTIWAGCEKMYCDV